MRPTIATSTSSTSKPRSGIISILLSFAVLLLVLPAARASAASQFHLDVGADVSECFLECHTNFTAIYNLPGRDTNGVELITGNCKSEQWLTLMPWCLAQACASAPDAAYAAEFGVSFCHKAGVQISMELPDQYKSAAAEYFQSRAYLSAGRKTVRWPFVITVAVSGAVVAGTAALIF